jgi:hypothetical protein
VYVRGRKKEKERKGKKGKKEKKRKIICPPPYWKRRVAGLVQLLAAPT